MNPPAVNGKRWVSACRRPPTSLREVRAPLLRSDPHVRVGPWPTTTALPLARPHPRPSILSLPPHSPSFSLPPHPRHPTPPDLSRAANPHVQVATSAPRQNPSIPNPAGRTTCFMPPCNPASKLNLSIEPKSQPGWKPRNQVKPRNMGKAADFRPTRNDGEQRCTLQHVASSARRSH